MAAQLKPISEQVIVITGASSGIGLATALMAAKRGAKVVLAARSDETLADIVKKIQGDGGIAFAVCADVTVRDDLEQIASQAVSTFGRIDTWVNNAGVAIYGKLEDVPEVDSRKLFDINFWGVVNGSLIALPYLKQSKGALINIGSEVSEAVVPLQGMYSASKHAVKGFTDALRVEVVDVDKQDVSITLIQPTAVDTPYPQHARNYMEQEPKLPGPMIEADKVAEAILEAAQKPKRDVKVGARAVVETLMGKFAGRLGDKVAAKFADKQQYDEKPRDPEGTLEKPGQSGQVKGGGPSKSAA